MISSRAAARCQGRNNINAWQQKKTVCYQLSVQFIRTAGLVLATFSVMTDPTVAQPSPEGDASCISLSERMGGTATAAPSFLLMFLPLSL